jgi:8-oxo-dGTP pyrophosphatase MutT (NUDIX family)
VTENLVPRAAATVVTLRDEPAGCEVLMVRRNLNSDFVGGAYVFPGGAVDEVDADPGARVLGLSDEEASARLGLERGGLAYYVAGLRELFEEAGLLVACGEDGRALDWDSPSASSLLGEARRALNAGTATLWDVLAGAGAWLDVRRTAYLAHWVTPVGPPRRFDTRFFVVEAPAGQVAAHDEAETVASRWLRPRDALAAHERGELEMIFPTVRNLQAVAEFDEVRGVLAYVNALRGIPRIEPRISTRDGHPHIELPGES